MSSAKRYRDTSVLAPTSVSPILLQPEHVSHLLGEQKRASYTQTDRWFSGKKVQKYLRVKKLAALIPWQESLLQQLFIILKHIIIGGRGREKLP